MSDTQLGSGAAQIGVSEDVAALAKQGAVLATGLAEPLAATIAACREILAYVNRHAVLTGRESDIGEELAKLNTLLDEAFSKLSTAVQQAAEAAAVSKFPREDG